MRPMLAACFATLAAAPGPAAAQPQETSACAAFQPKEDDPDEIVQAARRVATPRCRRAVAERTAPPELLSALDETDRFVREECPHRDRCGADRLPDVPIVLLCTLHPPWAERAMAEVAAHPPVSPYVVGISS